MLGWSLSTRRQLPRVEMKMWFGGEAASDAILLLSSKAGGEAAASDQHTNDTRARQYLEYSPD